MSKEEIDNIEEKAFLAAKCGIVTKWTSPDGFSVNNISPVGTIEDYRNHPEYETYLQRPHPHTINQ